MIVIYLLQRILNKRTRKRTLRVRTAGKLSWSVQSIMIKFCKSVTQAHMYIRHARCRSHGETPRQTQTQTQPQTPSLSLSLSFAHR